MLLVSRLPRPVRWTGLLIAVALLAISPAQVMAQGLVVTTAYPSVTVDPGGTARFPLTITTDVPERVDLVVVEAPEGWEARLRGGGSTIQAVFTTAGDEPVEAALEVEVPSEAAAGPYQVVLEATAAATAPVRMTLDLLVETVDVGDVALTAQFPDLSGPADARFRFDLELSNDTNQETTFSLETVAPPGWAVDARPSGQEQAATAVVAAGQTSRIQVTATPPTTAAAGEHSIIVRAVGGPQPAEANLTIEVTGTPSLVLTTAEGPLNARATVGSATTLNLVVTNDGTAPLANVAMAGTPPAGWTLEFTPSTIPVLEPDTQQAVTATLRPADNAIAGDYAVTVRASTDEANDSIELRTAVETSPLGGFIGLALLAVVAVGLLVVFRRYGRR